MLGRAAISDHATGEFPIMRRTTQFRQLIDRSEILLLPGAHDALSARLIELAGFEALTAGGYAAHATLLGAPDIGQLGLAEMADHYARLCDTTRLPLLAETLGTRLEAMLERHAAEFDYQLKLRVFRLDRLWDGELFKPQPFS